MQGNGQAAGTSGLRKLLCRGAVWWAGERYAAGAAGGAMPVYAINIGHSQVHSRSPTQARDENTRTDTQTRPSTHKPTCEG